MISAMGKPAKPGKSEKSEKPETVVLIFARAPLLGRVKTRLQVDFSAAECLSIYHKLLRHALATATALAAADTELCCLPNPNHPDLRALGIEFRCALRRQQGADLGERMLHAATAALRRYKKVILTGCDCPQLKTADLAAAARYLDDHDVVIGPASDGGYYLLALKTAPAPLFRGLTWGTDTVLRETRARIETMRLSRHELPQKDDLDHPEDYHRDKHLLD